MENPGLSWIMTLRGFLVSGTGPAPQRPATLRLERDHSPKRVICASPIKPAALRRTPTSRPDCRETSPRHRDLNRPSRNRLEGATPEPRRRIPGTRTAVPQIYPESPSNRAEGRSVTARNATARPPKPNISALSARSGRRRPRTAAPALAPSGSRSTRRLKAGNDPAARTRSPWRMRTGIPGPKRCDRERAFRGECACTFRRSGDCTKIRG